MPPPRKKPNPESFFLCRIIGNDLVPRHTLGQSRENVRFILDHEPELEGCHKFWILNRITDDQELARLTALLEERGQEFATLPFPIADYAKADWDYGRIPRGFIGSAEYSRLAKFEQLSVAAAFRRLKNIAAINNNGARNAALSIGRERAQWVLPWDGNCFLTCTAWQAIREAVLSRPRLSYFIVPMARVGDIGDNAMLLDAGFVPNPVDEPQIIFRNDADQRFDERYPYGEKPKVELLQRLNVPGPWDSWPRRPWDLPTPKPISAKNLWATAGWVARLSSGVPEQETGTGSAARRSLARNEAIIAFLDRLDEATHGLGVPDRGAGEIRA